MKKFLFTLTILSFFTLSSFAQKEYTEYWQNNNVSTKGFKSDKGVRVGNWTWFHENGKKEQEGSYDNNGKKIDTWTYYFENGKVKKEECYSDNGFNKAYYNNGQLYFSVQIKDGKRVGDYKEFHRVHV